MPSPANLRASYGPNIETAIVVISAAVLRSAVRIGHLAVVERLVEHVV
jgi:hypothetical protein